uniref:RING-type domain-containing protein n=1 Tax=Parastrongyloides trichosuri TaxID=131310 RepID=A0A0N4ZRK6_PARTI
MSSNMPSWLHCNACCVTYSAKSLYLTNCGHIFCLKCLGNDATKMENSCLTCQKKVKLQEIGPHLLSGQSSSPFFTDPEKLYNECAKKVHKIRQFQIYHNNRYIKMLQHQAKIDDGERINKKLKYALSEKNLLTRRYEDEIKYLKQENNVLKQRMEKQKENIKKMGDDLKKFKSSSQMQRKVTYGDGENKSSNNRNKDYMETSRTNFNGLNGISIAFNDRSKELDKNNKSFSSSCNENKNSYKISLPSSNMMFDNSINGGNMFFDEKFQVNGSKDYNYLREKPLFKPVASSTQCVEGLDVAMSCNGSIISDITPRKTH